MPLTPWTKNVLAHQDDKTYWDAQTYDGGTTLSYTPSDDWSGSMQSFIFTRSTPSGTREDVAVWSFHWAIEAGPGAPAVRLSGSQKASIETITNTMWTSMKVYIAPQWVLKEYQWRDFGILEPKSSKAPYARKYRPIDRITASGVAGTNAGTGCPDQVAMSMTWRTSSRRHWGRSYLGGLGINQLSTDRRFTNATADGVALAVRTAINSAAALPAITNFVVWSAVHSGMLSVNMLQVDDVPDVIRSRRAKQRNYARQYTS